MILRAGQAMLHVRPETGGGVAGWTWRGVPIMRPVSDADLASGEVRRLGAYPLIPFSGRIADGCFTWYGKTGRGQAVQLARNFPPEPHAIHGNAWHLAWSVAEQAADRVRLVLDSKGDAEWPFPYTASLAVHLLPDGLDVAMTLRAGAEMPAGLGWHPYFHRAPGAALGFEADRVWLADDRNIPVRTEAPEGEYRFTPERALGEAAIDNCYGGWRGTASLQVPGARVQVEADPVFDHLVVYTPPGRDYVCTEPATHAPNAVNRPEGTRLGMRVLAAGEALEGEVRVRVEAG